MENEIQLNGLHIYRREHDTRGKTKETIFIPLPENAWRSAGHCNCSYCKGSEAFWDTLALGKDKSDKDFTYTVHYPELHGKHKKY